MSVRLGDKIIAGISESDLRRLDVEDGTVIVAKARDADTVDGYHESDLSKAMEHRIKTYTALEQIGIVTGEETPVGIYNAMPNESMLMYFVNDGNLNNSMYAKLREIFQHDVRGTVLVYKLTSGRFVFDYLSIYGNRAFATYYSFTDTWTDWQMFLPLIGGTLTGALNIDKPDGIGLSLNNTANTTAYTRYKGKGEVLGHIGFNAKENPVFISADTTKSHSLLHTGNMAEHVLTLAGGTLRGHLGLADGYGQFYADENYLSLTTQSSTQNAKDKRALQLVNSSNSSNYADALRIIEIVNGAPTKTATFLNTSNKPTGTYVGNGDVTLRTINTGGIGSICMLRSSAVYVGFVTAFGAVMFSPSESKMEYFDSSKITFYNGVLTLCTDNGWVNYPDAIFTYQVL